MTRKVKIAVSLPGELVEVAKRAVRHGRAANVSAFIAKAIEERSTREGLATMLEEMLDETGGPLTPAENEWADRVYQEAIDWHESAPSP